MKMKDGDFPLSTAQYNIWLNEQFYSGSAINVIHGSLWMNEPTDPELLRQAILMVMDCSDIFRLRFADDDGEPVQYLDNREYECKIGLLCTGDEARELLDHRSVTPFSFENDNLYDLCIYPLTDGACVLSIRIHHILLDGFGMRLLCDRILTAYGDLKEGGQAAVAPSYFLQDLSGPELDAEASRSFWKDYLAALPDRPVFAHEKAGGMSRRILPKKLDRQLCEDIRGFCSEQQVTPYTLFAAALGLYLARIGQVEDAIIILPRLNRDRGQALSTLGVYTLAAPLRIRPYAGLTFPELCGEIMGEGQTISRHKEYGYSRILSDLKAAGEVEANLTEFTINFQKGALTASAKARLDFSACGAMANHLTLNVSEDLANGLYQIDYDYRRDLFSEERIAFFHDSLMQIIKEGLSGKRLEEISLLTPAEHAFLSAIGSGDAVPYDPQTTVVSLFKEAAARYPDRTAIIGVDKSLTFRELDALSDRLMVGLLERGIEREQLVAFMLPRTAQILVCMLGILKAGAAFLPIDPQYPEARIDYMLDNSQAPLLISDPSLPAADGRSYAAVADLLACDGTFSPSPITPDQLAYCIYTSGTTGQPKGVLLEHRGIVNITRPENNPFNRDICRHGRGIVAIGSICFDISLFEIFVPLLNGLFVVMAPEEELSDPAAIAKMVTDHQANILHCTPSRLSVYLTEDSFTAALNQVDIILSAGEVLPATLVNVLRDDYGVRIYNGYGPTEITIGAAITEAGDDLSIGRPIANTCIRIVDNQLRDMPVGAAGEILAGGAGTARGYLNLPEMTAEKFIKLAGQRFYRTGDIGYLREDGRLMYLGRNDDQIKLRGLRIELSEIENCLRRYVGINHCAVLVREISGQKHLAAFYSAAGDIRVEDLKFYLSRFLAPYMVPDIFVPMEQLPITINGKIDIHALGKYPITIARNYKEPGTPEEAALCRIFAAVLQLERVGADDNFFEIGGTSLLAAKVMLQARSENISLSYGTIFTNPTPELLAAAAGQESRPRETVSSLAHLDYSLIAPVLARNQAADLPPSRRLGNVLLTGATGFLGIHILKELLDHPESVDHIYCLIRPKGTAGCEQRLKSTLFYYFEEIEPQLLVNRLFALDGDVTTEGLLTTPTDFQIDTVIHSAANVSHFAYGDVLEQVNTKGVENVLSFAEKQGAAVVHVSTLSVGGYASKEEIKQGMALAEDSLYIGQRIDSEYILSKYNAEYLLLQAGAGGVPVKIMRVGNLQGRLADGEFQMNLRSNAFARQLKSYALLKSAPDRLATANVNFSPVDDTAKAIFLLAGSPEQYTVFHTFNPTSATYAAIFAAMEAAGYPVEWKPNPEFEAMVEDLAREEAGHPLVEGLLLEQRDIHLRMVPSTCHMTVALLERLGFSWGAITREYLDKYFYSLDTLGFFDV
ncbi:MAG TPA: amino acid adenylation domain-containing protein [Syntrophomonas sp.]|nr:amino acid adenylation domain-containing protein [Syntrophomonas sp.]